MNFDLRKPCKSCPFRTDVKPFINAERAAEIGDAITTQQQTFACHQHTQFDQDDEGEEFNVPHGGDQHCAGALILLEKLGKPNQMMRIAERLRMYDHTRLKMDSPVYPSVRAMVSAHRKANA